jgi:8-oxo-dGTP pyrophosphatase MutT (NUDIX family)
MITNPWKTLAKRDIYENNWIKLEEHDVINPAGGNNIYGKVHFKNIAIGIIPVDEEGNTWLVGQYRYTLNAYSWEIPEGGGPLGIPPLESAQRELREETGLIAKKWEHLLTLHNSNSVTDEVALIYLAEDLEQGEDDLEETEADLVVKKLPLQEAIAMVMRGEITDSMSVAGLLKIARLKNL